jgi:hypothetical protein
MQAQSFRVVARYDGSGLGGGAAQQGIPHVARARTARLYLRDSLAAAHARGTVGMDPLLRVRLCGHRHRFRVRSAAPVLHSAAATTCQRRHHTHPCTCTCTHCCTHTAARCTRTAAHAPPATALPLRAATSRTPSTSPTMRTHQCVPVSCCACVLEPTDYLPGEPLSDSPTPHRPASALQRTHPCLLHTPTHWCRCAVVSLGMY